MAGRTYHTEIPVLLRKKHRIFMKPLKEVILTHVLMDFDFELF